MTMSLLAALAAPLALGAPAPAAAPALRAASPTAPRHCLPPAPMFARGVAPLRAQKLGELPPASHYLAVYRQIENCPVPALVRTGIGR